MIDIDKYACISSSSLKNPTGDQARQPLALHITNNKGKTPSIKRLSAQEPIRQISVYHGLP